MKSLLRLLVLLALPWPAAAAPAVRLIVQAPCTGACPGPLFFTSVTSGELFAISVIAVDGTGMVDTAYTGTVNFASTDPLATLPSSYTFLPADRGFRLFLDAAILRTPGRQTITVTDPVNNLAPGTLTLTVTGALATPIPTLSGWMKILLALALAASGIWLSRLRH